jgi:hypothetical protein
MSEWVSFFVFFGGAAAFVGIICMPAWISAMRRSYQPHLCPRGCFESDEEYIQYMDRVKK